MKLFVAEAEVCIDVLIRCPFCSERQLQAEKEAFRLFGKMLVCENGYCGNYFLLPEVAHEENR